MGPLPLGKGLPLGRPLGWLGARLIFDDEPPVSRELLFGGELPLGRGFPLGEGLPLGN